MINNDFTIDPPDHPLAHQTRNKNHDKQVLQTPLIVVIARSAAKTKNTFSLWLHVRQKLLSTKCSRLFALIYFHAFNAWADERRSDQKSLFGVSQVYQLMYGLLFGEHELAIRNPILRSVSEGANVKECFTTFGHFPSALIPSHVARGH